MIRQYGKHKVDLPENIINSFDAVQCILHMEGYDVKFKESNKLKKAVFKGREIESNFRFKMSFYSGKKTINFSICQLHDKVTGIHVSGRSGTNYDIIFPEKFNDLQSIINGKLKEYDIV